MFLHESALVFTCVHLRKTLLHVFAPAKHHPTQLTLQRTINVFPPHTYTHTHTHTYIYTHIQTHAHTHIHTNTHTGTHTCTHTLTHAHTHTYVWGERERI